MLTQNKPGDHKVDIQSESPREVRIHLEPNFFNEHQALTQLHGFLKTVAGKTFGNCAFFSLEKMIDITTRSTNKEINFQELLNANKNSLLAFIKFQIDECFYERFSYSAVKGLFEKPLYLSLPFEIQDALKQLSEKLSEHTKFNASCGKITIIQKLIKEGGPIPSDLLFYYFMGLINNELAADPDFVKTLLKNGCSINGSSHKIQIYKKQNLPSGISPLIILFSIPYCDGEYNYKNLKSTVEVLKQFNVDITHEYNSKTAYDFAEENKYPKDILKLICPPTKKSCRLC